MPDATGPALRCLLVDDEPLAHRVLQEYIGKLDGFTITDRCFDGVAAINRLAAGGIDVVFLDIQMPSLTGLEVLEALRQNAPLVVLTTAYSEYAVDGFGYDQVVDYLRKPIKFTRFLQTAERLRKRHRQGARGLPATPTTDVARPQPPSSLLLQDDRILHRVPVSELSHVESYGNYVKAHLRDGEVVLGRRTLKDVERALRGHSFIRIHKRFLVKISEVRALEGAAVVLAAARLPVGKSYVGGVRVALGVAD